jgi:hypothetical protein
VLGRAHVFQNMGVIRRLGWGDEMPPDQDRGLDRPGNGAGPSLGIPAVRCPRCGRPNAADRVICFWCRYLLTAPPPKVGSEAWQWHVRRFGRAVSVVEPRRDWCVWASWLGLAASAAAVLGALAFTWGWWIGLGSARATIRARAAVAETVAGSSPWVTVGGVVGGDGLAFPCWLGAGRRGERVVCLIDTGLVHTMVNGVMLSRLGDKPLATTVPVQGGRGLVLVAVWPSIRVTPMTASGRLLPPLLDDVREPGGLEYTGLRGGPVAVVLGEDVLQHMRLTQVGRHWTLSYQPARG